MLGVCKAIVRRGNARKASRMKKLSRKAVDVARDMFCVERIRLLLFQKDRSFAKLARVEEENEK